MLESENARASTARRDAPICERGAYSGPSLLQRCEGREKNPNKRPTLADFRGCRDLAFHADVAALIHCGRGEDEASIDTRSQLIVAKRRGGRTGVAYARYNTSTLLFE